MNNGHISWVWNNVNSLSAVATIFSVIFALVVGLYQYSLKRDIESYRNIIDLNERAISRLQEEVSFLSRKVEILEKEQPSNIDSLVKIVEKNTRKISRLHTTVNQLENRN
ncbi:hypothetical protein HJ044_23785 [Vibrio parahaemolyticus]|nr:hypothetical protein [Vibrio parahaemolyticus]